IVSVLALVVSTYNGEFVCRKGIGEREDEMLLNLHSYYSLRYGTLSPRDLIEGMMKCGYDTAVLTDINNTTGSLEFIRLGREAGLNILAGMEYRSGDQPLYIGIARNHEGFRELNEILTEANRKKKPLPETAPAFDHAFVVYPYGARDVTALRENEFIGIRPAELNRIRLEP